jgi:hypothetical protein
MNEVSSNDVLINEPSTRLIPFYLNEQRNPSGFTIEEIWLLDDDELEYNHELVSWVFPTKKESDFNPEAPLLDEKQIRLWRVDPRLTENLRCSFHRYLRFFGLQYENGQVRQCEEKALWDHFNHNWLRVTRILESLRTLGLAEESQAFFGWLQQRFVHATAAAVTSMSRWSEAMEQ